MSQIPDDPEPRQALLDALVARDADRVDLVRAEYREWFVRNDDDSADREPWPDYFESAAFRLVNDLRDRDEKARTIGWARESAADPRLADISDVFERTGMARDPWVWTRPGLHAQLGRAIKAQDADAFGRSVAEYEEWATREFAPWPEVLLNELGLILRFTLDEDGPSWQAAMKWAETDDDRLTWLAHAARNFER